MIQFRPHQQSALDMLTKYSKGIVCAVTGAGKTLIGIGDTIREYQKPEDQTVVVVSPRILLTSQLCSEYTQYINNAHVLHIHSGDSDHYRTTNPKMIREWVKNVEGHKLIFTTYHSLHRLIESDIEIDTVHMDEAHNSVRKDFFPFVEQLSQKSKRFYSYTATPKYSSVYNKPGMNWSQVYGQMITNISASDMVKEGFIVPPQINTQERNVVRHKDFGAEHDCMTLLDMIVNEENMEKVLIASPNTKVMMRMLAETDFMTEVQSYGYEVLWITAKHGAFINNQKVKRDVFFQTLKEYGADPDKKFVILHYSILSEGIDCPGLTSCVLMRNMDYTAMVQTIGRVVRLHPDDSRRLSEGSLVPGKTEDYVKSHGFIHVPVYANTGIATSRKLQSVVDTAFVQGQPVITTIQK
jgi:superfamily II DNA or RNA helicase